MKILSYNIFGIKDTKAPIPDWDVRQKNIEIILYTILEDNDIKLACFQEVNEHNFDMLEKNFTS